jgi:hypothetical protein
MRTTLLLAASALLLPAASFAQPVSHFAPNGVEIDGDYLDDAGDPGADWYPSFEPFRDPIRQDDDTLCATSPAPKNDVTNSFVANDFDYLYVGMERLANNGNTSFFFRFDITGDGPSPGDFIFVFCFHSGASVTDTYVLEWNAQQGEFVQDATPPQIDFAVNLSRELAPFGAVDRHGRPSTTIEPGKFGEARIRLADIEGFDICDAADVTFFVETKSSCSLRSQCKDTTGELHFSFTPLDASLELSQPPDCTPEIVATANAVSPRPGAVTYQWFLDGEDITDRDPAWAGSDSITIQLGDECGSHQVGVIVDDGTCQVEDTQAIDVQRRPEALIGEANVDACTGVLHFSGTGSSDCNGTPLTFAWDFDSDGVIDATGEAGTFAYAGCGDRLITLRVSDGGCDSEPASVLVAVNAPPEAGLAINPSAASCMEIAFEVTSSDCNLTQPSDLIAESLSSITDFGDGSAPVMDSSGTHRYAACGTYVVRTTTTDAAGCSDFVERTVTVDVIAEVR